MAASGELARQETVPGHEARQVGKPVEAGVAARVEDQHRGQLHHVETQVTDRAASEDRLHLLGHHRGRAVAVGDGVRPLGEQRDPEHEEAERVAHGDQGLASVAPSGWRKLLTPLEMASSPVSDEPPLANERSSEMKARPISQPEPGEPIRPP